MSHTFPTIERPHGVIVGIVSWEASRIMDDYDTQSLCQPSFCCAIKGELPIS